MRRLMTHRTSGQAVSDRLLTFHQGKIPAPNTSHLARRSRGIARPPSSITGVWEDQAA